MITEDYVSFETAELLKEKGFTANIHGMYDHDGKFCEATFTDVEPYYCCYAPTVQMAMKWLREEHKLHIVILWDCGAYTGNNSFYYHIDRIDNYEDKGYNKVGFDSYEEACEAAIKYCLENLI